MLPPEVRADIERRVDADLLRTLWQQDPTGIATNYLAAGLAVWMHWERFDHTALLLWAGCWWASNSLYLSIHLAWRRRDAAGSVPRRVWFPMHIFCDAISALPVGLFAWFFSDVPEALWLNSTLIITYVAGVFAATLMSPVSYLSAAGWCLAPLLATHLREATRASYAVAIALAMFYAFLGLYSFVQARQIRGAVRSGYENEALARRLADETAKADAARDAAEQAREIAEAAQRDAEAAGRAKARFLAAATHDLRQPLHALALTLETVRLQTDAPHLAPHVGRAQSSARDLSGLFDALLDHARLDAGTVEPHPQAIALGPLLHALEAQHTPEAEARGLWLRARCPSDVVVRSDPVALRRILSNLIVNALHATERGGVLLAWRAAARAVEVRDSGRGIDPALHETIFDEFFRVPSSADDPARGGGLGLGLATVRRLSRLLGHHVSVRSRPGRGSVFSVQFAAGQLHTADAIEAPPAASPVPAAARVIVSIDGLRVLAIDDDPAIRASLAALLGHWKVDARVAANGAEARAACVGAWQPQVLLVDRRLGREDGPAVAAALRAALSPAPACVVVTGDTSPDQLQALAASGWPVLHKPVDPEALQRLLGDLRAALPQRPSASSSARDRTP